MRHGFIKVAAATPVVKVADCQFNSDNIIELIKDASLEGVHLLVLPELCVTAYTCGDLFFQQNLLDSARDCILRISTEVPKNMVVVFGAPVELRGKIHNCAIVASAGKILGVVPKLNIPNYGEFYEQRWFTPGLANEEFLELGDQKVVMSGKLIFTCNQLSSFRLACEVCEDLWVPNSPSVNHTINGATVIANVSASNQYYGKSTYRNKLVQGQSGKLVCGYVYADAGEGESSTDLVYTGQNMICENGVCLAQHSSHEGQLLISELDLQMLEDERRKHNTFVTTNDSSYRYIGFDIEPGETSLTRPIEKNPFVSENIKKMTAECHEIFKLQTLGLKRRLTHVNANSAVIGISGGLDSTLALLVTVNAFDMMGLDRENIICVTMPCFGTSDTTKNNAVAMVQNLGCRLIKIDITESVRQHFADIGQSENNYDTTFENAQARERTQVLMDLANKENAIVIGTGDLSELALGWATYNGDHMSMYGVNAGVPKTQVQAIVKIYAKECESDELREILYSVLETPISPELIPGGQETEDFVGPYALHDFFIYYVIKGACSPSKVYRLAKYAFGVEYSESEILKWLRVFYRRFFAQQYKRSCLPDGPKVGPVTLSPRGDWRMPSDASVHEWKYELENSLL